ATIGPTSPRPGLVPASKNRASAARTRDSAQRTDDNQPADNRDRSTAAAATRRDGRTACFPRKFRDRDKSDDRGPSSSPGSASPQSDNPDQDSAAAAPDAAQAADTRSPTGSI